MSRPAPLKAVLTGATGFVGSHLVDALVERGDAVRAVVRASSHTGRLREQGVELVEADLNDVDALAGAFAGRDVVFHVAGLIKALDPHDYFEVNAEGTRRVADAPTGTSAAPVKSIDGGVRASAPPAPRQYTLWLIQLTLSYARSKNSSPPVPATEGGVHDKDQLYDSPACSVNEDG